MGVAPVPPRVASTGAGARPADRVGGGGDRLRDGGVQHRRCARERHVRLGQPPLPRRGPRPATLPGDVAAAAERFGPVDVIGQWSAAAPRLGRIDRVPRPGPRRTVQRTDAGAARRPLPDGAGRGRPITDGVAATLQPRRRRRARPRRAAVGRRCRSRTRATSTRSSSSSAPDDLDAADMVTSPDRRHRRLRRGARDPRLRRRAPAERRPHHPRRRTATPRPRRSSSASPTS